MGTGIALEVSQRTPPDCWEGAARPVQKRKQKWWPGPGSSWLPWRYVSHWCGIAFGMIRWQFEPQSSSWRIWAALGKQGQNQAESWSQRWDPCLSGPLNFTFCKILRRSMWLSDNQLQGPFRVPRLTIQTILLLKLWSSKAGQFFNLSLQCINYTFQIEIDLGSSGPNTVPFTLIKPH